MTIAARTTGAGDAGDVDVHAARVTLTAGAQISSGSGLLDAQGQVMAGTGRGGSVTLDVTETLSLTGRDPVDGMPSSIVSQTLGAGAAGRITLTTPSLTLTDGARIGADTGGAGQAGDVLIQTGSLQLMSRAQINSSSGITLGETFLSGAGSGGKVTITATAPVLLSGPDTGLFTRSAGPGLGGDITLHAPRLTLMDHATISAESTGAGNAGNVTLTTQDSILSTQGTIVTRATQADGGNIQITAPRFLRLRNSLITAEVGGGAQTEGGNISIDPQFVVLQNSQIIANAFAGRGGNIAIQAQQVFLADPDSLVSASSALGINGQVAIQAPVTSVSGAIAPLPQTFAQAAELLRSRCSARVRSGRTSRLVLSGRDGVPWEPGTMLPSPLGETEQGSANVGIQGGRVRAWGALEVIHLLPTESPCARGQGVWETR